MKILCNCLLEAIDDVIKNNIFVFYDYINHSKHSLHKNSDKLQRLICLLHESFIKNT